MTRMIQFPGSPLQKAIYYRLCELKSVYPNLEITDTPQKDQVPPFLQIDDITSAFDGTQAGCIWDCEPIIHIWTGPDRRLATQVIGRKFNNELRDAVFRVLTQAKLEVEGWYVIFSNYPLHTSCSLDPNGTDYHGILIVRASLSLLRR